MVINCAYHISQLKQCCLYLIIVSIECLQRVFKRLGVLAELPDGTGEVLGACDEVAPRSIQGHARYHSCKQQKVEEGRGGGAQM